MSCLSIFFIILNPAYKTRSTSSSAVYLAILLLSLGFSLRKAQQLSLTFDIYLKVTKKSIINKKMGIKVKVMVSNLSTNMKWPVGSLRPRCLKL